MIKRLLKKFPYKWYSPEMDIWWNIGNVYDIISSPFRRIYIWVVKSFKYSLFLWEDRDFDYIYVLKLLQYKLKKTRECIEENDIIESSLIVGAEIRHVEELIRRIMEDDFCVEEMLIHDKKWGELTLNTQPTEHAGFHRILFDRTNIKSDEDRAQEESEFLEINRRKEKEYEECWNELFDTMKIKMIKWWD